MVETYWQVGRLVVEEEQKGQERAKYGEYLIGRLSKDLTVKYGRGFTERNIWAMKQFYTTYPKLHALRAESKGNEKSYSARSQLTWTHFRTLMRIDNELERNF